MQRSDLFFDWSTQISSAMGWVKRGRLGKSSVLELLLIEKKVGRFKKRVRMLEQVDLGIEGEDGGGLEGVGSGEADPDLEVAHTVDLQGEAGAGPRAPVTCPRAAVIMPPGAVIGAHSILGTGICILMIKS